MNGAALSHPKILHGRALRERLAELRAAGKRLVCTNGCYDILHPGHADLLHRAKLLGDALLLAVNDDASVRRLGKGAGRPVNPLAVRMYMAAQLNCVDLVTSFSEDTPLECIRLVRPQVLVKGGDWPLENIVGRDIVEADGGTVYSLPLLPGYSTTGLLARIRQLQTDEG
ncbi:MAG: adenylyltransferase/cytidyltransferase family protein [Deltaproteobacteria bacterium]|jgi:rfaE bifunctional protein nucleotidyltransferase chain/domain|nr:adenylyltransferase/cytidyltransferase family protein [Deltaproteobacteria bacterium]